MEYVAYVMIAFASACLSSTFGVGGAALLLTLGALVLPVRETIGLATIMFTTASLAKTILYRFDLDWRLALVFSIGSVPFAFLGAHLMVTLPTAVVRNLLVIVVIAYVLYDLSGRFKLPPLNSAASLIAAAAYGFLSGLVGTGQIIKVALFNAAGIRKQAFVGTMAVTGLLSNIAQLTTYLKAGVITHHHRGIALSLIIAAIGAAILGRKLLRNMSTTGFEWGVRLVLLISAAILALG